MNVPYDQSDVLFVCTANTIDTILNRFLNRMESSFGYTAVEKSRSHGSILLPAKMKKMGGKHRI